jgi:hypothetical protein
MVVSFDGCQNPLSLYGTMAVNRNSRLSSRKKFPHPPPKVIFCFNNLTDVRYNKEVERGLEKRNEVSRNGGTMPFRSKKDSRVSPGSKPGIRGVSLSGGRLCRGKAGFE